MWSYAAGNLCLKECTSFALCNTHAKHPHSASLAKQPFIAKNHCFTDLLLASTGWSYLLSKHAPATINPTSETAASLEWFREPESQDTAALADGVQWSGRHAFFSVTIRAYPGPTKEFPTPPWTIRPHQVFFLLPAYKLLLKHVKPAVKTVKARSEGAESVLQNWKWFKKAATQGNINFVEYASLTNMLVVSLLMRRIKKKKIRILGGKVRSGSSIELFKTDDGKWAWNNLKQGLRGTCTDWKLLQQIRHELTSS